MHLADGETLTGDVVINATGPATRLTATASLLLQHLLHRGLLVPDATDMGSASTAINGADPRRRLSDRGPTSAPGDLVARTLYGTVVCGEAVNAAAWPG